MWLEESKGWWIIIGLVMTWCETRTGYYLNQCWPNYMTPYGFNMTPYGVTRPQWARDWSVMLMYIEGLDAWMTSEVEFNRCSSWSGSSRVSRIMIRNGFDWGSNCYFVAIAIRALHIRSMHRSLYKARNTENEAPFYSFPYISAIEIKCIM